MPQKLAAFGGACYRCAVNVRAAIAVPLDYGSVERGISARHVQALIRKGEIDREDVYRVIPERTFKRRLAQNARLRTAEADAVARLLRVAALARWAFGDPVQVRQFLELPNPALSGRTPRLMATTYAGAREVEAVLYRFVFGDYT
jgi:putative toxin-antitoxin system antitoxin component (TIGR02293 family)